MLPSAVLTARWTVSTTLGGSTWTPPSRETSRGPSRPSWPTRTVASVRDALENSRYGRCVYLGDNDIADTQVASLLFAGGQTATITLSAFTELRSRHTIISGTQAEATVTAAGVELYSFSDRRRRFWAADGAESAGLEASHGGGDRALVHRYLDEIGEAYEGRTAGVRGSPAHAPRGLRHRRGPSPQHSSRSPGSAGAGSRRSLVPISSIGRRPNGGPPMKGARLITDADPASEEVARLAAAGVAVAHPSAPSGTA